MLRAKDHGLTFTWDDPFLIITYPKGARVRVHASAIVALYEETMPVVIPLEPPPVAEPKPEEGDYVPVLEPPKAMRRAK